MLRGARIAEPPLPYSGDRERGRVRVRSSASGDAREVKGEVDARLNPRGVARRFTSDEAPQAVAHARVLSREQDLGAQALARAVKIDDDRVAHGDGVEPREESSAHRVARDATVEGLVDCGAPQREGRAVPRGPLLGTRDERAFAGAHRAPPSGRVPCACGAPRRVGTRPARTRNRRAAAGATREVRAPLRAEPTSRDEPRIANRDGLVEGVDDRVDRWIGLVDARGAVADEHGLGMSGPRKMRRGHAAELARHVGKEAIVAVEPQHHSRALARGEPDDDERIARLEAKHHRQGLEEERAVVVPRILHARTVAWRDAARMARRALVGSLM